MRDIGASLVEFVRFYAFLVKQVYRYGRDRAHDMMGGDPRDE